MAVLQVPRVKAGKRGAVPEGALGLAVERIRAVSRYAGGRVQFPEVKLTAVRRQGPGGTLAQASLRVRGHVVRARAAGRTPEEAIQRLGHRLQGQLEQATAPSRRRHCGRRLGRAARQPAPPF